MRWIDILLLGLYLGGVRSTCPMGQAMRFSSSGVGECTPCPANCDYCALGKDGKDLECEVCRDGFHLEGLECRPCDARCLYCWGPELYQCYSLREGLYFSYADQGIKTCEIEGCFACRGDGTCVSCKMGYHNAATGTEADCRSCGVEHCYYCSEKNDQFIGKSFRSCESCEMGFVLKDGSCLACPAGCEYCESPDTCLSCKPNTIFSWETRQCEDRENSLCIRRESSGKCVECDFDSVLVAGVCELCSLRDKECLYCARDDKSGAICVDCRRGFRLEAGVCVACGPNCHTCTASGCNYCEQGFILAGDTCVACDVKNCEVCAESKRCAVCLPGMVPDADGNCQFCPKNCSHCVDRDSCATCGLGFLRLADENKSEVPCVSKCPETFVPDFRLSQCLSEEQKKAKELADQQYVNSMLLPTPINSDPQLPGSSDSSEPAEPVEPVEPQARLPPPRKHDKVRLLEQVNKLEISLLAERALNSKQPPDEKRSLACRFHGILQREIRGDLDSFYICICDRGFTGEFCDLRKTFRSEFRQEVSKVIGDLERAAGDPRFHSTRLLLKSLVKLVKLELDRHALTRLLALAKKHLRFHSDADHRRDLYVFYDGAIVSLYRGFEDSKLRDQKSIVGLEASKSAIESFRSISEAIQMIEASVENSDSFFRLSVSTATPLLASFAFDEFPLSVASDGSPLLVHNPNIDSPSKHFPQTAIFLAFKDPNSPGKSTFSLIAVNFAMQLFADFCRRNSLTLTTNVLYLKNVDTFGFSLFVKNAQTGIEGVRIRFAMLFMPAFDRIEDNIRCLALNFESHMNEIEGLVDAVDEDKQTVTCSFDVYFEFKKYYFAVALKGK